MAGVKISALPAIAVPAMSDVFPVVQGGTTYKETITQLGTLLVPISGGTMTGNLILNTSSPSTDLQAASKGYVDSVAQGLTIQGACRLGTTTALTVTYSNGTSGVGATLTNAGAQAALTLDGVAAAVNDRILVKNQASALQNGIYTVTNIGSGATNWVLTRATDYDQVAEIQPGDLVIITAGSTLANSSWVETATVTAIGTDSISFSQFSASLPITVPNGGTGLTTTTAYGLLTGGTTATGAFQNGGTGTSGQVYVSGGASALGTWTSATGTGNIVKATSPSLTTPNVGAATFTSLQGASNGASILGSDGAVVAGFYISGGTSINNLHITSASTGNSPSIQAFGGDVNVSLDLLGSGTGGVKVKGTGTNDSAASGYVGEYISSQVTAGSPLTGFLTGTYVNLTSISLTAGDWDVWGNVGVSSTTVTTLLGGINTTSVTLPDNSLIFYFKGLATSAAIISPVPQQRLSLSGTTTVYLVFSADFTGASPNAYGILAARRVR